MLLEHLVLATLSGSQSKYGTGHSWLGTASLHVPLGLNDCAKYTAHDLPTREGIDLKESLVI